MKLAKEQSKNVEEWMGHLRKKQTNAIIKKTIGDWKNQSINDNDMITKVIWELIKIKKTNEIISEQGFCWAGRDKLQIDQQSQY